MREKTTIYDRDRFVFWGLLAAAAIALWFGWKAFWFLTDDAFIAFRYVSNSRFGYGYVWNPPPFLPVEGYTSFLWVLLLDAVWRTTGIEPPLAANPISVAFAFGTLAAGASLLMRMRRPESLRRWGFVFLALFLAFLLSNQTFLAWSSSGLETAMFGFFIMLWVWSVLCVRRDPPRVLFAALSAALIALTRPDGLLFCAATVAMAGILIARRGLDARARRRAAIGLAPLLLVVAHLLWRRWFYGQWLPNTYYAKVVSIRPFSGTLYLISFTLEYALWFAAGTIVAAGWVVVRKQSRRALLTAETGVRGLMIGALCAHAAYYTWIVGGDHFEYRVYSHLLPLIFLAFIWALHQLAWKFAASFGMAALFLALSLPVPWSHWRLTRNLNSRDETLMMQVPIAPSWPPGFRVYAGWFDRAQSWLIPRLVCVRRQEHKVFWQVTAQLYPPRAVGLLAPRDGFPVIALPCVGIAGWAMPHVNVIDTLGLNDFVIARTPVEADRAYAMAHARKSPPGYIESFRPNVAATNDELKVEPRDAPLTESEIVAIEALWRQKAADGRLTDSQHDPDAPRD